MRNFKKIFLLIFVILSVEYVNAQQLAFPSAKGGGAYSTGGRGGQVLHVTNLAFPLVFDVNLERFVGDTNSPDWDGSFAKALLTTGPRTVVFDVSGVIDATILNVYDSLLSGSDYDNITIAGQTAPAGGITILTDEFIFFDVSNITIRYIRFRNEASSIHDSLWFRGGNNIILDHCTFSHGGDESGSFAANYGRSHDPVVIMGNITIQNCFFQDSKTGSILGTGSQIGDFTIVNNVFSNISHRFPNPKGNGQYDIINNIVYNWKSRLVRITGEGTYNVINNYYKTSANGLRLPGWFGNSNITSNFLQRLQTQSNFNPLIYTAGSIVTGQRETPLLDDRDMWSVFAGSHLTENTQVPDQYFASTAFPLVGQNYLIKTAQSAYIDVLNDVGANKTLNANGTIYPFLDDKDASDILMIQNDSYNGSFFDNKNIIPYPIVPQNIRPIDTYDTNPHIPEEYLISKGVSGTSTIHNELAPSGYTWIEEYHNEIDSTNDEQCLTDITLVDEILSSTNMIEEVSNTINSSAKLNSNTNITYSAGQRILLTYNSNTGVTGGFHAKAGSSFLAKIEGCTPENSSKESSNTDKTNPSNFDKQDSLLNNDDDLKIYPNPAKDKITIIIKNKKIESYVLYDINGRIIKANANLKSQNHTISVNDFQKGIYIIRISLEDGSIVNRNIILQ